ncbi:MAG: SDR family oxidoreductase [Bacteroidetes bacterium]|nr:MAG: SDR family oxidoreductase [Bacteroidota bacterium]
MAETALITGASSGIGLELAKIFAANGINVVLVARSQPQLQQLAQQLQAEHGIEAHVLAYDLSQYSHAKTIFDWCRTAGISINYLVNNAGFGHWSVFAESQWPKQEQMINLNITTLTYLTHLFLPAMVAQKRGKIMNVASTAAFQPGPIMSVYFATKAYVLHFTEAIAHELAGTGVTATALCPGATESDFQNKAAMQESRLFKGKKLPTSAAVAAYGYKTMQQGKVVAVHGFMNWLMAASVGLAPRSLVVKMVAYLQRK